MTVTLDDPSSVSVRQHPLLQQQQQQQQQHHPVIGSQTCASNQGVRPNHQEALPSSEESERNCRHYVTCAHAIDTE